MIRDQRRQQSPSVAEAARKSFVRRRIDRLLGLEHAQPVHLTRLSRGNARGNARVVFNRLRFVIRNCDMKDDDAGDGGGDDSDNWDDWDDDGDNGDVVYEQDDTSSFVAPSLPTSSSAASIGLASSPPTSRPPTSRPPTSSPPTSSPLITSSPPTSSPPTSSSLEASSLEALVVRLEALVTCPITHEVMRDPVVTPDGISYERDALAEWLNICPVEPSTRKPLTLDQLNPNRLGCSVALLLETWAQAKALATHERQM